MSHIVSERGPVTGLAAGGVGAKGIKTTCCLLRNVCDASTGIIGFGLWSMNCNPLVTECLNFTSVCPGGRCVFCDSQKICSFQDGSWNGKGCLLSSVQMVIDY